MNERGGNIRAAAVAGQFYPSQPDALARVIDDELQAAQRRSENARTSYDGARPKALIVPHAGYLYSGSIAASGYARILRWRDEIRTIVLLGPAHRVHVKSMAASSADAWSTPLGTVRVARDTLARTLHLPGMIFDDDAHALEHSLEVHVPFLQRILREGWALLPIVVGPAATDEIADLLDAVWGGDETLIVISTDLSHYHDQDTARRIDQQTAEAILAGDCAAISPAGACGAYPIRGILTAAKRHGLAVEQVDLANSGDTAGSADRVVGYGAFVLVPNDAADITEKEKSILLAVAEEAIRAKLEGRDSRPPGDASNTPLLNSPGASFVTLRDGERLLGCIGTLDPRRSLIRDVTDNAFGAAFRDPRMPELSADEFVRMSLHISILTAAVPVVVGSLTELSASLRPFVDGVVIEAGNHRGTFLPSVWEQLPDPDEFLEHLWKKAGLAPGTWPKGLHVLRYRTIEFADDGPRARPSGA